MNKLACVSAVALFAAAPAMAEDWDFILTNSSGKDIKTVEVSAAGAGTWKPNVIDPESRKDMTIKANARTTVHFDKGSGCKYDLKATFADDSSAVWNGFDVCANSYLTIRYDAGRATFKGN
jgi:hypothetical protein